MTIGDPEISLYWRQARGQDDVLICNVSRCNARSPSGYIIRTDTGDQSLHVICSEIIVETPCNGSLLFA